MRIKWTAIHSVVDDRSAATWGDVAPAAERVKRDPSLDKEKEADQKNALWRGFGGADRAIKGDVNHR
jgi:hypothetical protein